MKPQVDGYGPDRSHVLAERLSAERLATYSAAGGDRAAALALYDWNIEVSAALWADLQRLEVVMRNAMHDQLTSHYGRYWFDRRGLLDGRGRDDVTVARRRLKKPETDGRIVAELSFGFWRYLLAKRYVHTVWTPAVRHAFPYLQPQRRKVVEHQVVRLHELRNRIAHCEPVLARDITLDGRDIATVAGYIHPQLSDWITEKSQVDAVLARRP